MWVTYCMTVYSTFYRISLYYKHPVSKLSVVFVSIDTAFLIDIPYVLAFWPSSGIVHSLIAGWLFL